MRHGCSMASRSLWTVYSYVMVAQRKNALIHFSLFCANHRGRGLCHCVACLMYSKMTSGCNKKQLFKGKSRKRQSKPIFVPHTHARTHALISYPWHKKSETKPKRADFVLTTARYNIGHCSRYYFHSVIVGVRVRFCVRPQFIVRARALFIVAKFS